MLFKGAHVRKDSRAVAAGALNAIKSPLSRKINKSQQFIAGFERWLVTVKI